MMNQSDERISGLRDEALDPAPAQQALICACPPVCTVSDKVLDPAPAQQAFVCACAICTISDEALDPAPAQQAIICFGNPFCNVSCLAPKFWAISD